MEFRFHNGEGVLAATGRRCGLFIDLGTGRPKRVEGEMRRRFEDYLIAEPVPAAAGQTKA